MDQVCLNFVIRYQGIEVYHPFNVDQVHLNFVVRYQGIKVKVSFREFAGVFLGMASRTLHVTMWNLWLLGKLGA